MDIVAGKIGDIRGGFAFDAAAMIRGRARTMIDDAARPTSSAAQTSGAA